mgnify:CR=1 FL=1|jgi:hypothetical protein
MSKKHVIEVQAPEGKIPVYDESTRTISFIDEDIKTRVRTVEDAFEVLGEEYPNWLNSAPYSVRKMYELQTVLRALNKGHNFSLTEGRVWYPWIRFYVQSKLPDSEKKNVIAKFTSEGERYYLLGGDANAGGGSGPGCFHSYDGVGYSSAAAGCLACKDEETALYVATQFGQLVFDAIYAGKAWYVWNY